MSTWFKSTPSALTLCSKAIDAIAGIKKNGFAVVPDKRRETPVENRASLLVAEGVIEIQNIEKGVVLITGCSHSKVEAIILATKAYLGSHIELVEGGFHLFPYDGDYISKLARRMKDELGVRRVAPAHCTGNLAFKIFRDVYGENYNYAGVESEVMFSH